MKHASLCFGLALAAMTGVSAASWAADSSSMQTTDQVATMPSDPARVQNAAQQAYAANTNPLASAGTTGPYDQEDAFKDSRGNPLPGWSVFGGDIQAGGGE